jgi:flavin-binding protein dodecin
MAESDLSWEDATMVALERARKTLRHIRSIEVGNFVALVADGEIKTYQISAKISFDLEPDEFEPRARFFHQHRFSISYPGDPAC